ncbi:MAG: methionyl-tRNA synthetase, methionyl-tRNA synthetase [Candidatus Parcubacteria bacterium]|jgi:methionyl-tRNA synthetase
MSKPFYITTTLPYVNAEPHVGFAMEIIRADVIARYKKLTGHDVFFNTGTDEHGLKLWESAQKSGKDVRDYVDGYAEKFRGLVELLGISDDIHFIRTTDAHHESAAQKLWQICDERGYIYKGKYSAKYCVGCELEKTDSELDEKGRCPIHPNRELELIDEENYFFALSKVAPLLEKYYADHQQLVIPDFRYNEMKAFLSRGLQDFSISRSAEKMPWGVPVPGDASQVMYVWFDALTNYISTLGWPDGEVSEKNGDETLFEKFWQNGDKVQYCGKDNTRQQSLTWQAMLLSAGLPGTDHVVVNGFINSGGQKMSKSLGNVISPYDVVAVFQPVAGNLASDVLRYILLRHTNSFEDSDLTMEAMIEWYNAGLANGLGNLASRILTLSQKYLISAPTSAPDFSNHIDMKEFSIKLQEFDIVTATDYVWKEVQSLDKYIQETEAFKVVKTDEEKGKALIGEYVARLHSITTMLAPLMPKTHDLLKALIQQNMKPEKPLFQRI